MSCEEPKPEYNSDVDVWSETPPKRQEETTQDTPKKKRKRKPITLTEEPQYEYWHPSHWRYRPNTREYAPVLPTDEDQIRSTPLPRQTVAQLLWWSRTPAGRRQLMPEPHVKIIMTGGLMFNE